MIFPYYINITIQGLPKTTANANQHWKARWTEARKWKSLVFQHAMLKQRPQSPLLKAKVKLTRFAHGKEPDRDNLRTSFKHIVDGLVAAKIIIDDSPQVIGEPEIAWEKASPKYGHIMIEVWGDETK